MSPREIDARRPGLAAGETVGRRRLIAEMQDILPARLHDRYWPPCLLIFLAERHLKPFIAGSFDFEREEIDIARFNRLVTPFLPGSSQFLVSLAFHLFSADNPLPEDGLIGLRLLDNRNYQVALAAIRLAYDREPDYLITQGGYTRWLSSAF